MDTALAFIVSGLLGSVVVVLCAQRVPPLERRWLLTVLLLSLTVRLSTATMFATIPETRIFHEDAEGYELGGVLASAGWRGEGPPYDLRHDRPQNYGYFYVPAAL